MTPDLPAQPEPAEILLYQTEDGQTRLEVRLQDETVWLTQKRMAELFQKNVRTINEHIRNIFAEGELVQESVVRKFRITADDGKIYDTQHYNLDEKMDLDEMMEVSDGSRLELENPLSKGARVAPFVVRASPDDFSDLTKASESALEFWDNPIDCEE